MQPIGATTNVGIGNAPDGTALSAAAGVGTADVPVCRSRSGPMADRETRSGDDFRGGSRQGAQRVPERMPDELDGIERLADDDQPLGTPAM